MLDMKKVVQRQIYEKYRGVIDDFVLLVSTVQPMRIDIQTHNSESDSLPLAESQ